MSPSLKNKKHVDTQTSDLLSQQIGDLLAVQGKNSTEMKYIKEKIEPIKDIGESVKLLSQQIEFTNKNLAELIAGTTELQKDVRHTQSRLQNLEHDNSDCQKDLAQVKEDILQLETRAAAIEKAQGDHAQTVEMIKWAAVTVAGTILTVTVTYFANFIFR